MGLRACAEPGDGATEACRHVGAERSQRELAAHGEQATAAVVGAVARAACSEPRDVHELRRALEARETFIATAGHELRNPMAGILMTVTNMAYLAERDPQTPVWVRSRLASLERQARHFVRRATTLLDVSRLAAGEPALDLRPVDLGRVVDEIVRELAPEAERANCRMDVRLDRGVLGMWDRHAIETIAMNLLSNALKYGLGKPVDVRVTATDRIACLFVRDRGVGISPADQERIFDGFERATARGDRPGFGVGLWLARQLARAQGGDITVESDPGQGSIFTVNIPWEIHEPRS